MTVRDAAILKRYYAKIKAHLPCPQKVKNDIIEQIKSSTSDYISNHPEANAQEIMNYFGSAESIAQSYISVEDEEMASKIIKRTKTIKTVLTLFAIVVLILALTISGVIIWNNYATVIDGATVYESVIETE